LRVKELDVLRAVAVLLVIGRHFDINSYWHRGGWTGVDLFFVLSGFLIAGLLFTEYKKHNELRIGRFLLRRGLKIYPAFYVFLLFTIGLYLAFHRPISGGRLLGEILSLQNYAGGLWTHTWSLAVEEHFYLLLPLALLWMSRRKQDGAPAFRMLPWMYVSCAAAILAVRVWNSTQDVSTAHAKLGYTHLSLDGLLLGVTIAYFYQFRRAGYDRIVCGREGAFLLVGAALALPCFLLDLETSAFIQTVGRMMASWGYALILMGAMAWPWRILGTGRLASAMAFAGSHSYSVYLWHAMVGTWGLEILRRVRLLPVDRAAQFAIYLVASFAIGIAMARLVEIPVLRLRDRLFPTRSAALVDERGPRRTEEQVIGAVVQKEA
jgi:peptidoglycan/LPS O-acetylase OafA/YrhL